MRCTYNATQDACARPSSSKPGFSVGAGAGGVLARGRSRAADQKATLAKIKARYQAAAEAYDDGELEKTQAQLQQALKLAEENGLGGEQAGRADLRPLWRARGRRPQGHGAGGEVLRQGDRHQPGDPGAADDGLEGGAGGVRARREPGGRRRAATSAAAAEGRGPDGGGRRRQDARPAKPSKPTGRAARRPRSDAENEKLVDDLAAAKVNESLQQAEKEKLQREKQEQEKELAGAKGHAQELAKEKATWKQNADQASSSPTPRRSCSISIATSRTATSRSPT